MCKHKWWFNVGRAAMRLKTYFNPCVSINKLDKTFQAVSAVWHAILYLKKFNISIILVSIFHAYMFYDLLLLRCLYGFVTAGLTAKNGLKMVKTIKYILTSYSIKICTTWTWNLHQSILFVKHSTADGSIALFKFMNLDQLFYTSYI